MMFYFILRARARVCVCARVFFFAFVASAHFFCFKIFFFVVWDARKLEEKRMRKKFAFHYSAVTALNYDLHTKTI